MLPNASPAFDKNKDAPTQNKIKNQNKLHGNGNGLKNKLLYYFSQFFLPSSVPFPYFVLVHALMHYTFNE